MYSSLLVLSECICLFDALRYNLRVFFVLSSVLEFLPFCSDHSQLTFIRLLSLYCLLLSPAYLRYPFFLRSSKPVSLKHIPCAVVSSYRCYRIYSSSLIISPLFFSFWKFSILLYTCLYILLVSTFGLFMFIIPQPHYLAVSFLCSLFALFVFFLPPLSLLLSSSVLFDVFIVPFIFANDLMLTISYRNEFAVCILLPFVI